MILAADVPRLENGTLKWIDVMSLNFLTAIFNPYGKYVLNCSMKYCSMFNLDLAVSSSLSNRGHSNIGVIWKSSIEHLPVLK